MGLVAGVTYIRSEMAITMEFIILSLTPARPEAQL